MHRTGPTTWTGDGWSLSCEVSGVNPETCNSLWRAVGTEGTWEGPWDGSAPTVILKDSPPYSGRFLYRGL
jgi:hypothetical protein